MTNSEVGGVCDRKKEPELINDVLHRAKKMLVYSSDTSIENRRPITPLLLPPPPILSTSPQSVYNSRVQIAVNNSRNTTEYNRLQPSRVEYNSRVTAVAHPRRILSPDLVFVLLPRVVDLVVLFVHPLVVLVQILHPVQRHQPLLLGVKLGRLGHVVVQLQACGSAG